MTGRTVTVDKRDMQTPSYYSNDPYLRDDRLVAIQSEIEVFVKGKLA
ncbi:MAG: hypothetical protein ACRD4P_02825 [Bryobacteraceae bacterium]